MKALMVRDQLVLVGTIRKDGSPRISPVEPEFADGGLYLGMMWQSRKALDLLRDPRCTVTTLVHDRLAKDGEFKLHGRAVAVSDLEERALYCEALFRRIGWKPDEPRFHLFAVDVDSAASFVTEGDSRVMTRWRAGEPGRRFRQYADGRTVAVE